MSQRLSLNRLQQILDGARGARIAVLGDAMLDIYLVGDVDRVSPEAPVPIVRIVEQRYALGGAANVAQNVAATGALCRLVAVVGQDAAGARLRTMLGEICETDTLVTMVSRCTTRKTRIVARSQQLLRFDEEVDSDLDPADLAAVIAGIERALSDADALILEDYNKGVLVPATIAAAIARARARGIPIIVDPKFRNFFAYGGATIFKPNRRELESALGAAVDLAHPETLPSVLERLEVENLLLTLGDQGMLLVGGSGAVAQIPTVARQVYDVVGAGDTVTAYLAAALVSGASPLEAAEVANIAAGIEVGKLGAATVSAGEILAFADAAALTS